MKKTINFIRNLDFTTWIEIALIIAWNIISTVEPVGGFNYSGVSFWIIALIIMGIELYEMENVK